MGIKMRDVEIGKEFVVIAGPCSVESHESVSKKSI